MEICKICSGEFSLSPDSLVLCRHHDGFVHHGCCIKRCSQDNRVCSHAVAIYDRMPIIN